MYGTGYKSEYKNWGSINYSTGQENKLIEIFIISLGSNREERFQFKQTFEFTCSRPYSEIQLSILANNIMCTNWEI